MAAPTQELLAASGAAMPAGTPVPNRSRSFETRRSSFHATIEAIVAPAPGMAPISPPIADPRRIVRQSPNNSRALGSAPVMPAPGAVALRPPAAAFQRLGDGEEADQHRHQPEAVHEHVRAQREPRRPREHVQPDDEENESQQRADDPLQRIPAHEVRDDG